MFGYFHAWYCRDFTRGEVPSYEKWLYRIRSGRILRDISAVCFCAFPHRWTPPPERMNQWNFGISMTSLMSKLISVFVGCQVLRSRLQKFGLRTSSYMWQKHRGTSIGGDIREVTRPRFHDHHLCTSFFFSFLFLWGGRGVKANLIEKNRRECPLQNKKNPTEMDSKAHVPPLPNLDQGLADSFFTHFNFLLSPSMF